MCVFIRVSAHICVCTMFLKKRFNRAYLLTAGPAAKNCGKRRNTTTKLAAHAIISSISSFHL
jgi:hypothetical protein